MKTDFAVRTHTFERATTLALGGELDLVSSPALDRTLDAVLASDAELIVVDLRGLEFMDSTGLHVLVKAQHRMDERAGASPSSGVATTSSACSS